LLCAAVLYVITQSNPQGLSAVDQLVKADVSFHVFFQGQPVDCKWSWRECLLQIMKYTLDIAY